MEIVQVSSTDTRFILIRYYTAKVIRVKRMLHKINMLM